MINDPCSLDQAISILNEMIAADPIAMRDLIEQRVPCKEGIADHPTVQVRAETNGYSVGLLGVLNGIFGNHEDGFGAISAYFEVGCDSCGLEADDPDDGKPCPNCGATLKYQLVRFSRREG